MPDLEDEFDYSTVAGSVDNVINRRTPGIKTEELVDRILKVAEYLAGHPFYPYQKPFAYRLVWAILEREAEEITALFSRQSGKSETLSMVAAALMFVLPILTESFPNDDRFCYRDPKSGLIRDYSNGFWVAIFAPKKDQATIIFKRVRGFFARPTVQQLCADEGLTFEANNGNTLQLSSGSFIKCSTASDQASIEGDTLHLGILDESQDISDEKASKSIGPMMAATGGSMVKIGTANARKSHFLQSCKRNERRQRQGYTHNHFCVRWDEAARYNSDYERYVLNEMSKLGERSDEFRMSYMCEWMLARGMALTDEVLSTLKVSASEYAPYHERQKVPLPGKHYTAGIDFGKIHDSTVVTIIEVDWDTPRQTLEGFTPEEGAFTVEVFGKHVCDWLEMQGDDYEAQFHVIKKFLRQWGVERMALDYTGVGVGLGDRFQAHFDDTDIELLTYTDPNKDMIGRLFMSDIHTGMLTFPAGPVTSESIEYKEFCAQMLDLEKEYKPKTGYLSLHHPEMRGAHDDYCFAAGSLVLTEHGEVAIEDVTVGTRVMTHLGWRKVQASTQTGVQDVYEHAGLIATSSHPVWCESRRSYLSLDTLGTSDTVLVWPHTAKHKSLMESSSTDTRNRNDGTYECTSGLTPKTSQPPTLCTATSTRSITGLSLKGTLSTTSTRILSITTSETWKLDQEDSTRENTPESACRIQSTSAPAQSTSRATKTGRTSGRRTPHGNNICETGQRISGSTCESSPASAKSAAKNSSPVPTGQNQTDSAACSVGEEVIIAGIARSRKLHARNVPVYNLTVEEAHTFVCDGVLVHNCDSLQLAIYAASTRPYGGEVEESDNMFIME